jgi:hypothetical protein
MPCIDPGREALPFGPHLDTETLFPAANPCFERIPLKPGRRLARIAVQPHRVASTLCLFGVLGCVHPIPIPHPPGSATAPALRRRERRITTDLGEPRWAC